VAEGKLGLRQSDAVFHHTRQLPELMEKIFQNVSGEKLTGIGVSEKPREAKGSYMPCFLVGLAAARSLSAALGIPCYRFSHQQGHIASALYSSQRKDLFSERFLAFHLSGGTTEALLVTPGDHGIPSCQLVASSLDLKAGQAIDRIGVAMGLPFPAGKHLDQLARDSSANFRIHPALKGADMSLSGLQNKCEGMLNKGEKREDVALFCFQYLIATLEGCLNELIRCYGSLPVVFSGGVSANTFIRQHFSEKYGAVFASPEFSSDNGLGAGVLAALRMGAG
jgi:N6-L-threonylcarbamoyladenine synthase